MGMRFPSFQVLNQADARPWPFQHWLKSDGRFRIILFAGNVLSSSQSNRVKSLCDTISSPSSFLHRVTPPNGHIDSVIEILTIHSAKRTEVEFFDFPQILHPFDAEKGWDYNKVFVDDVSYHEGDGKAYEGYGVDKERGCVVVVRPDGYVGWLGEIEDSEELERYFGAVVLDGVGHKERVKKVKRAV